MGKRNTAQSHTETKQEHSVFQKKMTTQPISIGKCEWLQFTYQWQRNVFHFPFYTTIFFYLWIHIFSHSDKSESLPSESFTNLPYSRSHQFINTLLQFLTLYLFMWCCFSCFNTCQYVFVYVFLMIFDGC